MIPKIIDLFSGCGGLSLGFVKAGFDIAAGIEIVPEAVQTVSYNLEWRYGIEDRHICADITETEGTVFNDKFGAEGCIVIGGPPCQAYSLAGRAKLKSLGEDRVNTKDARGYLFHDFLRFVFDTDARAVVMENVPDSTTFGKLNIPQTVCDELEEHGYNACWTILNSADYGVPQIRERVFVLAIKKSENKELQLPVPTHRSRDNYITNNQKRLEGFKAYRSFVMPVSSDNAPDEWVTVENAFSDMPVLFESADAKYRQPQLNEVAFYKTEACNSFQKEMRNWYGTEYPTVSANSFRNTARDFRIFEKMKQGDNYIVAHEIAVKLFEEDARLLDYKPGTENYEKLYKKTVPVYDTDKFEGKWKRLDGSRPSHTLVAHLSKDTYSHIHPWEPRGISVREAARIQSFPDDFLFNCSMGEAYRQIGNAVPPLLAYGIAKAFYKTFSE